MRNELEFPRTPKSETTSPHLSENIIDQELSSLETELSFSDRMELVRDLFEEVCAFKASASREKELEGMCSTQEARAGGTLKHYFLPDIPGGDGDTKKIREGYDKYTKYIKTDNHVFINISQGTMWAILKENNPYLKISMSECSTIIGENKHELIVAHISYSALNEIEAVMDFMKKNNIPLNKIFAITSLKSSQSNKSEANLNDRATTKEPYLRHGISPDNILGFEYDPGSFISEKERVSHNLTQVLVGKEGFFKWSFDLKRTFGTSSYQEEVIGEFRDQEVVKF
jgi:hypothetical protein